MKGAFKCYWLASYPKSGNTWIRAFINAYITGHLDINRMPLTEGDNSPNEIQRCLSTPISDTPLEMIQYARGITLYNRLCCTKEAPVIFKTHNAKIKVGEVPLIDPNMTEGAVYIVRDPRAVCVSLAKHNGSSINQAISVMCNEEYILTPPLLRPGSLGHHLGSWSNHVKSWAMPEKADIKTLVLKYEDLKQDPINWFTVLSNFMSIKGTKRELKKAVERSSLPNLMKQEEIKAFHENPSEMNKKRDDGSKFFGASKDWREVLTKQQQDRIIVDHGEMMEQFNYL